MNKKENRGSRRSRKMIREAYRAYQRKRTKSEPVSCSRETSPDFVRLVQGLKHHCTAANAKCGSYRVI